MTMLERDVEAYLVAQVKTLGGMAVKHTSPARRSVPDRLVLLPLGRVVFIELKRPGGKPTEAQLREHDRLRALGMDVRVIDTKEGVSAFIEEMRCQPPDSSHDPTRTP